MVTMVKIALLSAMVFLVGACAKSTEKTATKSDGKYVNVFGAKLKGLKNRTPLDVVVKVDRPVEAEKYIEPLTSELGGAFKKCEQAWPEVDSILRLDFPHEKNMQMGTPLELCLYEQFNSALVFESEQRFSILLRRAKK